MPSVQRLPICARAQMRYGGFFDYDRKASRLSAINEEFENPSVWSDAQRAQALGKEKKELEGVVAVLAALDADLRHTQELFAVARDEADEAVLIAIETDVAALERGVAQIEFRRMFNHPADPNNCFIDIQSGAGGTEACDW